MSAYAAIHVGCKQLGIEEDDRRDLYERVTKKRSLKLMSFAEVRKVKDELKRLGFKKTLNPRRNALEGAYAKKLQALWIAAWNLGIVRNKSDNALLAFVKRQTGIDHTRFLRHKEDGNKAVETMKAWMEREGDVDWSDSEINQPQWLYKTSGAKIALAQWWKLHKGEGSDCFTTFPNAVSDIAGKRLSEFLDADWIRVMNALGTQIRAAK